jgi:hypothetical protein
MACICNLDQFLEFFGDLAWYTHDYSWCKEVESAFCHLLNGLRYGFIFSYKIMKLHGVFNV